MAAFSGEDEMEFLKTWAEHRRLATKYQLDVFHYQIIRAAVSQKRFSLTGKSNFVILGKPICRRAFQKILGIGTGRLDRFLAHAREGYVEPPRDGRRGFKVVAESDSPASRVAESWLHWVWNHVAEYLPDDSATQTI